ncbi:MAG: 50S ribosomal protein L13 [Planctomycetes bacterium]|nr:50S ribosomal protein L13 [Planctomycetota bacterium]
MNCTTHAKASTADRQWLHISAKDLVLGRLAARVAQILMGKHKPTYTAHCDTGDFVVITDAADIVVTGNKARQKVYIHHTGWIGGLVRRPYAEVQAKHPTQIIELAVRRMLPKTKLGRHMFAKLKVYAGAEHPHEAQNPKTIKLTLS